MLVSSNKLLRRAQKEGYAVGAFSTYNPLPRARKTCDVLALFAPAIRRMQCVVESKIAMFGSDGKAG